MPALSHFLQLLHMCMYGLALQLSMHKQTSVSADQMFHSRDSSKMRAEAPCPLHLMCVENECPLSLNTAVQKIRQADLRTVRAA